MDVEKIIKELFDKYLGKRVIKNPESNPTEIVCETVPAVVLGDRGVAIAIIDSSKPHYHKKIIEKYKVLRGKLTVFKNGKLYKLQAGDELTVMPDEIHYAIGDETWVEVISEPGWTPDDHFLVE